MRSVGRTGPRPAGGLAPWLRASAVGAACVCLLRLCAAGAAGQAGPLAHGHVPTGSVLVESEALRLEAHWYRAADTGDLPVSGGAVLRSNRMDARATGEVTLPPGRYAVWVRSYDNGNYAHHYGYDVVLNGVRRTMSRVEPVKASMVWERWGEVRGGRISVLLDRADGFNCASDCLLFTPDTHYLPAGPPEPFRARLPAAMPRRGAAVVVRGLTDAARGAALTLGVKHAGVPLWVTAAVAGTRVALPDMRSFRPGIYEVVVQTEAGAAAGRETSMGTFRLADRGHVRAAVAKVRRYRGTPTVFIEGKPVFAFTMLSLGGPERWKEFAATGAHLYTIDCGLGNGRPGAFDGESVDQAFQALLLADPEAYVFPRVGVTAPAWWVQDHPDEECLFEGARRSGVQSLASRPWLDDVGAHLARFIRHVRQSPYADRVIGYHLCTGYSAEWQAWGLWDNERGDFSPAFARAFRAWLRARYRTLGALRAAWTDPTVTFDTASVPSRAEREKVGPLLRPRQGFGRVLDFYAFYPLPAAAAIRHFARIAKRESSGRSLVGVFYGYAPQYGDLAPESQHLALRQVLACPDVDFLCSPAMYSDRQPGGTSTFMSATESVQLHGKFWYDEADVRTYLAKDPVGRCADLAQTMGVLKREFGHVLARGAGLWWFDMAGGWFSDPAILRLFGRMRDAGESLLHDPRRAELPEETAVVLDERSLLRTPAAGSSLNYHALTAQVLGLGRTGFRSGLYLLSDLARVPRRRLYVFLNAWDLGEPERRAIDALKRDGATLVWVYAAGYGGMGPDSPAGVEALTGIHVQVTNEPGSLAAATSAGEALGYDGVGAPRFVVDDRAAVPLARYADGGVAAAERDFGTWRSVTCGVPGLPPAFLRDLARRAGVHIYSDTDDALYVGRGALTIHARSAGAKVIRLPGRFRVDELCAEGPPLSAVGDTLRLTMGACETRVFRVRALASRVPVRRGRPAPRPPERSGPEDDDGGGRT